MVLTNIRAYYLDPNQGLESESWKGVKVWNLPRVQGFKCSNA